jgi:hypothetical protein
VANVKLVLTWDLQDGKEREFFEFYVSEFSTGIQRLGLTITEHWYTLAGAGPQIVLGGIVTNAEVARELIASADFLRLRDRLFEYVEDFHLRITKPNNGNFQL